jgi:hypothetical protein
VRNQGIADVTPIVWRMAPGIVVAPTGFVASILTPANVAEILTGVQAQDLKGENLSGFLAEIASAFDKDKRHDAAKLVLTSTPVPLFERPDGAFESWVSAGTECDPGFAINLLADDDLNDEQKNRVLARTDDLALVSAPLSVEALLKDTTRPKTRSALVERLSDGIRACPSDSARSRLAKHMIVSLPSLSGDDLYSVARYIGDLGGVSALERDDETLGMLDGDQTNVLAKAFPTSHRFRNA